LLYRAYKVLAPFAGIELPLAGKLSRPSLFRMQHLLTSSEPSGAIEKAREWPLPIGLKGRCLACCTRPLLPCPSAERSAFCWRRGGAPTRQPLSISSLRLALEMQSQGAAGTCKPRFGTQAATLVKQFRSKYVRSVYELGHKSLPQPPLLQSVSPSTEVKPESR
jgi:hypothetical protein